MNKEQEEMKFLGFIGIYKESYKIIRSSRKIFTKITLSTFILPVIFIFLAQISFSILLFLFILRSEFLQILRTPSSTPNHQKLINHLNARALTFEFASIVISIICFLILYLLFFTSAVVYTAACVTGRNITFRKVISIFPRVWRRLVVTSLCSCAAFIAYFMAAILVVSIFIVIPFGSKIGRSFLTIILPFGTLYLHAVSSLANVVTVLEDSFAVQAVMKGEKLIRGNIFMTMAIFFLKFVLINLIMVVFALVVMKSIESPSSDADSWTLLRILSYQILVLLVFAVLQLFWLVIGTMIYFVCKSYHNESIDKLALLNDSEVELVGEEAPSMKVKNGGFLV